MIMKETNRLNLAHLSTTSAHTEDNEHLPLQPLALTEVAERSAEFLRRKSEPPRKSLDVRKVVYDARFACY
jgi:hypothetical protein